MGHRQEIIEEEELGQLTGDTDTDTDTDTAHNSCWRWCKMKQCCKIRQSCKIKQSCKIQLCCKISQCCFSDCCNKSDVAEEIVLSDLSRTNHDLSKSWPDLSGKNKSERSGFATI